MEYKVKSIVRADMFGTKIEREYPMKEEERNKSKEKMKKTLSKIDKLYSKEMSYKSSNPIKKLLKSKNKSKVYLKTNRKPIDLMRAEW